MASRGLLPQLQSKLTNFSHKLSKDGRRYYDELLHRNRSYIVSPPTVPQCQELSKRLFYTRLASLPSRYESFWKEVDFLKQKMMNRQDLKIEELGVAAMFTAECYAWLCVGEIVGRGFTFTGYYV